MDTAQQLLIVAHAPSPNTRILLDAIVDGARSPEISGVNVITKSPFETDANDVLSADAILLGTTENLGYMSGALKDFFDRIYYSCLEETQGLPFSFYIRAGHDGTGTRRGIESITTGLRWKAIHEPLTCKGKWQDEFATDCRELGMLMAAGLEAGIF
jgi:multimeric flavodoxin WrbA